MLFVFGAYLFMLGPTVLLYMYLNHLAFPYIADDSLLLPYWWIEQVQYFPEWLRETIFFGVPIAVFAGCIGGMRLGGFLKTVSIVEVVLAILLLLPYVFFGLVVFLGSVI